MDWEQLFRILGTVGATMQDMQSAYNNAVPNALGALLAQRKAAQKAAGGILHHLFGDPSPTMSPQAPQVPMLAGPQSNAPWQRGIMDLIRPY